MLSIVKRVFILVIMLMLLSGCSSDIQAEALSISPVTIEPEPLQTQSVGWKYDGARITFRSEMMGFRSTNAYEITDPKTVEYIFTSLQGSKVTSDTPELNNNNINRYQIELWNNIGSESSMLYYYTLYDKAYLVRNGGLWEIDVDFARYIDAFLENTNITYLSDNNDAFALFKSYGWTLDRCIHQRGQA